MKRMKSYFITDSFLKYKNLILKLGSKGFILWVPLIPGPACRYTVLLETTRDCRNTYGREITYTRCTTYYFVRYLQNLNIIKY